jgi:lipopolysaccharide biosynthesis regulator YciM
MIDPLYLLPVLLLMALAWFAGRSYGLARKGNQESSRQLAQNYFQGINFLLNEQPDQAIDTFIHSVEVTPATLETHLALGNLMRQRGEIERAIRVHQNLLSRPNLSTQQIRQARLELGRDFLKAGLLDRAERLFLDLVEDESGELRQASLLHLVQIYRDEQEWDKAIRATDMMDRKHQVRGGQALAVEQAQFCCELAVKAMANGDLLQARRQLKSALKFNRNAARASLLWGELELRQRNYGEALRHYCAVPKQQSDYLPEVLGPLRRCFREMGNDAGLIKLLHDWLASYPGASVLGALTEEIAQQQGERQAIEFLTNYLKDRPTLKGLNALLRFHLKQQMDREGREHLVLLQKLLDALLSRRSAYRCIQCGFKGNQLHWLCPQCLQWETVRPVKGLEGE